MKKMAVCLASVCMLFSGCKAKYTTNSNQEPTFSSSTVPEDSEIPLNEESGIAIDVSAAEEVYMQYAEEFDPNKFYGLEDPELHQYIEDAIYTDLVSRFESEDYIINNVNTVYISKEYLEELEYNSKENIYFGYTLSELDNQFQGKKYVFTLGENGETEVKVFEEYDDDTYEKALKNVAIGSGVILVCVTVSVATAGTAAAPISMVFAASAKTGATMALSAGMFSSVFNGTLTAVKTGDMDQALKAAALSGSNSFKWGAIGGALIGGVSEACSLYSASSASSSTNLIDDTLPKWKQAEKRALKQYGGEEQVSYLGGEKVSSMTPGATRPDIVRQVGNRLEAIEVKYYDLSNPNNLNELIRECRREISARIVEMPRETAQRIVLDVTDRGFSEELVNATTDFIQGKLWDIYPNIPIDIIWGL